MFVSPLEGFPLVAGVLIGAFVPPMLLGIVLMKSKQEGGPRLLTHVEKLRAGQGPGCLGPGARAASLATCLLSFLWAGIISSRLFLPGGVWATSTSRRPSCWLGPFRENTALPTRSSTSLGVLVTGSAWGDLDHRRTSSSPCSHP